MKHLKKTLALFLALCFLAVIPLTAAAENDYDQVIVGNWKIYIIYNAETEETRLAAGNESRLVVNKDGTGTMYISEKHSDFRWAFKENLNQSDVIGYRYSCTKIAGTEVELFYSTEGSFSGMLVMMIQGLGMLIYVKA